MNTIKKWAIIIVPCTRESREIQPGIEYTAMNISRMYKYIGTEHLDILNIFQENNMVYLKLVPKGTIAGPGPVVLPEQIRSLYLKDPRCLIGLDIQNYMRFTDAPGIQELRFDFYDNDK
ncbi:hypothetical protein [Bacillus sp. CDB3]|uniref:hypothetical protein n=1 Tax=Bacillus sp. CDB3 TaxID=360310 RepID=UPI0009D830C3|nr:hypothetical protein [Bacillus sp. CDB3]OQR53309.1 hypothetical protein CDB3_30780 [Bacillus sp. CDB3]